MADYIGVLTELKSRRDALVEEVAGLNTAIAAIDRLNTRSGNLPPTGAAVGKAESAISNAPVNRSSTVYADMKMKQALKSFMEAGGGRRTTAEIAKALVAGGYKSKSKKLANIVYNNLLEMSTKEDAIIVKDGSGWRYQQP